MKRALITSSTAFVVVAIGCAPDAEPPTTSCNSITDCAIGMACDQSTHQCIKEPANRFLGRFHCKVSSTSVPDLQLSEVVGNAGRVRFALPNTTCAFKTTSKSVSIFVSDDDGGERLFINLKEGLTGRVEIGPNITKGDDSPTPPSVEVYNDKGFTREATSVSGFINLSTAIADGADLEAYLDVTVTLPPNHVDAVMGEPCPNGLADCGTALPSVGGAALCFQSTVFPNTKPFCTKGCKSDGDCALGKAVCNNGTCRRACTTNAQCADIQSTCEPPASTQESAGCQQSGP